MSDKEVQRSGSRTRLRSRSRSGSERSRRRSPEKRRPEVNSSGSEFRKLWVGGLPRDSRPSDLEKAFASVGRVSDVKIRTSFRDTYAFFVLEISKASDVDVIPALESLPVLGRNIKVDFARPHGRDRSRSRSRRRSRSPPRPAVHGNPPPFYPPAHGAIPPTGLHHPGGPYPGPPFYPPAPFPYSGTPYPGVHGAPGALGGGVGGGVVKIRVENIPEDMEWRELKSVASDFAAVTFAKTWRDDSGRGGAGLLEVADLGSAERVVQGLDGKRMEGCRERLRLVIERARDTIARRR